MNPLIALAAKEVTLHDQIVQALLEHVSGDDPGFGNMVGEIMDLVMNQGKTIHQAIVLFSWSPEYPLCKKKP